MRRPLLLIILLVLLILLVFGVTSCGSTTGEKGEQEAITPTTTATGIHCGYERWKVKTGQDPTAAQVKMTPKLTTIKDESSVKSPLPPVTGKYPPQTPRLPGEEQVITVQSRLIAYTTEQDNDLHLVLQDATTKMIVEIPNPACVGNSPWVAQVTAARNAFLAKTGYKPVPPPPGKYSPPFIKTNLPITVTGVRFYDFIHGQYGVAPNGVEIHPALDIKF